MGVRQVLGAQPAERAWQHLASTNPGLGRARHFGASGPHQAAQAPGLGAAGGGCAAGSAWNLVRASLVGV